VRALARQACSRILVGGDFVQTGTGVARTDILRLKRDGTLDPDFEVTVSSSGATAINAIVVDGDFAYVGGRFEKISNVARSNIAKLTHDGTVVAAWSADLSGPTDVVHAIAVGGGKVCVGGDFSAHDLWGIGRLDAATGAIDLNGRPQPNTAVRALELVGPWLYAGGSFTGTTPAAYARLMRVDPAGIGAIDANWRPGADANVLALYADRARARLYVGGEFADVAATRRDGLARFGQIVDPDVIFADSWEIQRR
jgi:hypothetical protein